MTTMAPQDAEQPETGPFVLRSLLEDIPLSADGDTDDIEINCVEFLGKKSIHLAKLLKSYTKVAYRTP